MGGNSLNSNHNSNHNEFAPKNKTQPLSIHSQFLISSFGAPFQAFSFSSAVKLLCVGGTPTRTKVRPRRARPGKVGSQAGNARRGRARPEKVGSQAGNAHRRRVRPGKVGSQAAKARRMRARPGKVGSQAAIVQRNGSQRSSGGRPSEKVGPETGEPALKPDPCATEGRRGRRPHCRQFPSLRSLPNSETIASISLMLKRSLLITRS